MAIVTETRRLSVVPLTGPPLSIKASQGDTNRRITFILYGLYGNYTIPDGTYTRCKATTPSGKELDLAVSSAEDNDIVFTIPKEITNEPGSTIARFAMYNSMSNQSGVVHTDNFEIYVVPSGNAGLNSNATSLYG